MKVFSSFPYEGKSTDHVFPGTNDSNGTVNDYTFALYDAEEKTFEIPFALNENNIITLLRKKNGVYTMEEHSLFVTQEVLQV